MSFPQDCDPRYEAGNAHVHIQYAFGEPTNLLIMYSPTLRDRDDLLQKSESQFEISDESAYSIVPSRMSMSIYTGHTTDSGAPKSEENLVYKPLTFENELFTARVYKRNYRTPALQRLFRGTEQRTSEKIRPRTVAQRNVEESDGSGADNFTIGAPGPTQWRPTKAQSATSVPTGGQPAWDEETNKGETNASPNAAPSISVAEACEQGNVEVVEIFLNSGGNVNACVLGKNARFLDWSPIHFACKGGHIQIVEILLSNGADKEKLSHRSQERPLHLAIEAGHVAMVRYFLDNGTNISTPDGVGAQAIHVAAKCRSTAILSFLLDRGVAIESAMANGHQPLHMASQQSNRANVIRFLCSRGADIEAKTCYGFTPLSYACRENAVDNMEALLELGAAHSPHGLSILAIALDHGYLEATRLLLEHGLDPNLPISGRRSALHRLITMDNNLNEYSLPKATEILKLLLAYSADGNLQDSNGNTPLHCLCSRSEIQIRLQIESANILLRSMKDVDTVNFAGKTALGVLVKNDRGHRLAGRLLQSGARLLQKRQGVEIGLDIDRSSVEHLSLVSFYLQRGPNTFTKEFGYLLEDPDKDSYRLHRLHRFPLVDLRRLLSDPPESFELENRSWVRYDGTTPISHGEQISLARTSKISGS